MKLSGLFLPFLLIVTYSESNHACSMDSFEKNPLSGFTDAIAKDGYIDHLTTIRSVIQCAAQCTDDKHCSSFFYSKTNSLCQTHENEFMSTTNLQPSPNTVYFVKITPETSTTFGFGIMTVPQIPITATTPGVSTYNTAPTTTIADAPTTTPSQICSTEGTYVLITLGDGEQLWLSVYKHTVGHTQAAQQCEFDSGNLFAISSFYRLLAVQEMLGCENYDGHRYWIDGKPEDSDHSIWAAGPTMLTMTLDYWMLIPSSTNCGGMCTCVMIDAFVGSYMQATQCTDTMYYVCERPA